MIFVHTVNEGQYLSDRGIHVWRNKVIDIESHQKSEDIRVLVDGNARGAGRLYDFLSELPHAFRNESRRRIFAPVISERCRGV